MFCYVKFEAKAPDATEGELGPSLAFNICFSQNLSDKWKVAGPRQGVGFPAHPYFFYCTNTFSEKDPKHTAPKEMEMGNQISPSSGLTAPDIIFNPSFYILPSIRSVP